MIFSKNKILLIISFLLLIVWFVSFYIYKVNNLQNTWLLEISKITNYNYSNCEKIYKANTSEYFVKKEYKNNILKNIKNCNQMYNDLNLFTEIKNENNQKENKITPPFLYNYQFVNWQVNEKWIYDYDIEMNDNIDLGNSSFSLYFSNDNLEWLENIIWSFPENINGDIKNIISFLYLKNLYLKNNIKIVNSKLNNSQDNKDLITQIKKYQNKDFWFKKYIQKNESDIQTTSFVVQNLIKLKNIWVNIDANLINNWIGFLNNKFENISEPNLKTNVALTLIKWWIKKDLGLDITLLNNKSIIDYSYYLYLKENKLTKNIMDNIDYLKTKTDNLDILEKSLFLSLLLDVDYINYSIDTNNNKIKNSKDIQIQNKQYFDEILNSLYSINYYNEFMRWVEKMQLFEMFLKYTNIYSLDKNKSKFWYMLWIIFNREKLFWIWRVVPSYKKYTFTANEVIYDREWSFRLANIDWAKMNFWLMFKQKLLDYSNIEKQNPDLTIKRNIFEIKDDMLLKKWILNNNSNIWYKLKEDNMFLENNIYKIELTIKNKSNSWDVVIEDYIPDNFVFVKIDDKYNKNLWYENIIYKQNKLKLNYKFNKEIKFEYFITPKNKWVFDYYSALVYLKDNPNIISNTSYYKIEVK